MPRKNHGKNKYIKLKVSFFSIKNMIKTLAQNVFKLGLTVSALTVDVGVRIESSLFGNVNIDNFKKRNHKKVKTLKGSD